MKVFFLILFQSSALIGHSQNVGLGVATPLERLEISGKLRTDSITIANGGSIADFLIKSDAQGTVGHRKGHGGMAFTYIICWAGVFPNPSGGNHTGGPYVGDVRLFVGDFAPSGWKLCNGQYLKKDSIINSALYSLIGDAYGSTDTTFALPDLRGLVPVGVGTSPAGYGWTRGQKNN